MTGSPRFIWPGVRVTRYSKDILRGDRTGLLALRKRIRLLITKHRNPLSWSRRGWTRSSSWDVKIYPAKLASGDIRCSLHLRPEPSCVRSCSPFKASKQRQPLTAERHSAGAKGSKGLLVQPSVENDLLAKLPLLSPEIPKLLLTIRHAPCGLAHHRLNDPVRLTLLHESRQLGS